MVTRREFLKLSAGTSSIVAIGAAAPQFLLQAAARQQSGGDRENVLVVVQLSGGNDGLNSVIPFRDEHYYKSRPKLAIAKNDVLKINDRLGFHPALRGFADLLEDDKLSIVQGVGYDKPNRSHFESMDIWHSCFRKDRKRETGWLGRYLDQLSLKRTSNDVAALHLGAEKQPLAVVAQNVRVPSIRSIKQFRLEDAGKPEVKQAIEQLAGVDRSSKDALLGFVQSSTSSALVASQRVELATRKKAAQASYPDTPLAKKLAVVAQLIAAGLDTRIYYLEIAGFDTHSQQPGAHAGLLRQVAGGLQAFLQDIDRQGHGDRVLAMCFSEFGRRVQENASQGTDHGAAAPMFLAGNRVISGPIGKHPSLTDLLDGDLKYHTDFREVYSAVLDKWLGWESESVLGGKYAAAPILRS